ncbi:MAG: HAD hydrolase family protein, partial [Chloroflexaceae bacterium]|nr:HAD hydrolase family protein [Chloroflexaceae bacterium]
MSTFPFDIVAVDLDGTLATSTETISPATQQAMRQLQAQGVQLVIASARMPAA